MLTSRGYPRLNFKLSCSSPPPSSRLSTPSAISLHNGQQKQYMEPHNHRMRSLYSSHPVPSSHPSQISHLTSHQKTSTPESYTTTGTAYQHSGRSRAELSPAMERWMLETSKQRPWSTPDRRSNTQQHQQQSGCALDYSDEDRGRTGSSRL